MTVKTHLETWQKRWGCFCALSLFLDSVLGRADDEDQLLLGSRRLINLERVLTDDDRLGVRAPHEFFLQAVSDLFVLTVVGDRGEAAVFVRFRPAPPDPRGSDSDADLQALVGQLRSALNETLVVLPGSELTWIGRVVSLDAYEGPDADTAKAAVDRGHTLGIVTELDGLLCLTRDAQNPEHYEIVTALLGKQAEVFGLLTDDDGLSMVQVTLCREAP